MEQTIEYKGHTIEITRDSDPLNPRKDWDGHLGKMVCWHRNYNLGDEQPNEDSHEWIEMMLEYDDEVLDTKRDELSHNDYADWLLEEFGKKHIFQVLHLYDHSGISMSCQSFVGRAPHARWDSGRVGLIYVSREEADEKYKEWGKDWIEQYHSGKSIEEVFNTLLEGEVETYNQYLTGEVYAYNIDDYEGDSCSGYFGDEGVEQAIEEAKSNIDYMEMKSVKDHAKRIKYWIKGKVPFIYRKAFQSL